MSDTAYLENISKLMLRRGVIFGTKSVLSSLFSFSIAPDSEIIQRILNAHEKV